MRQNANTKKHVENIRGKRKRYTSNERQRRRFGAHVFSCPVRRLVAIIGLRRDLRGSQSQIRKEILAGDLESQQFSRLTEVKLARSHEGNSDRNKVISEDEFESDSIQHATQGARTLKRCRKRRMKRNYHLYCASESNKHLVYNNNYEIRKNSAKIKPFH